MSKKIIHKDDEEKRLTRFFNLNDKDVIIHTEAEALKFMRCKIIDLELPLFNKKYEIAVDGSNFPSMIFGDETLDKPVITGHFKESNLHFSTFNFCHFKDMRFNSLNLVKTSFNFCTFENCTFWDVNAQSAEFQDCEFKNVHIRNSNFAESCFFYCNFDVKFNSSNLFGTRFVGGNTERLYVELNCNTLDTDFDNCKKAFEPQSSLEMGSSHQLKLFQLFVDKKINKMDFGETSLIGAIVKNTYIEDLNLSEMNLNKVTFQNVYFRNVKFDRSKMQDTVFYNCYFVNCSFDDINVSEFSTSFYNCEFYRCGMAGSNANRIILVRTNCIYFGLSVSTIDDKNMQYFFENAYFNVSEINGSNLKNLSMAQCIFNDVKIHHTMIKTYDANSMFYKVDFFGSQISNRDMALEENKDCSLQNVFIDCTPENIEFVKSFSATKE